MIFSTRIYVPTGYRKYTSDCQYVPQADKRQDGPGLPQTHWSIPYVSEARQTQGIFPTANPNSWEDIHDL